MTDDDEETSQELVMPFVSVASKGGPFDDAAFTAGYEMGLLDAALKWSTDGHPIVERTIREENRAQADLLAMRHGWSAEFMDAENGWVFAVFREMPPT